MKLQEKKELGLKLWLKGATLTQISKELNISRPTITNYIKSLGYTIVNPSKKYNYNENYFENIDSEEKAYWLGFIFADGCVGSRKKQRSLEITLKKRDRKHLVKFINAINGDESQISEKRINLNGKEFIAYRVIVNCTKMCNDLIKHGAVPRKSLILKFPKHLEPKLIKHFIRGYLDGDGCIDFPRCRVSIVGTQEFLTSLQDYFESLGAPRTKMSRKRGNKAYSIENGGKGAKLILEDLYGQSSIFLDRKYIKALAHLAQQSQES